MEEMETWEVVNGLLARGLKIEVVSGVLRVGPRELMTEETAAVIRAHRAGLLVFVMGGAIDDEIQWRLTAMLEQLLPLSWPCAIPTLYAMRNAQANKEDCGSCGELLDVGEGNSDCCGACARAKDIALSLWMQRPAQSVRAA
jgi:hypothetical protein